MAKDNEKTTLPDDLARFCAEIESRFANLPDGAARLQVVTALDANAIVEAGAGTGKTSLTVSRVLYGLCTGRHALSRLVVITFTEKAAAELRDRIRQGLEDVVDRYGASVRHFAEAALQHLDVACISTIHSFCSRVLREFPIEAGLAPDFSVADELEARLLMEDAWEDWVEEQVASPDTPLADLLKRDVTLDDLQAAAFRLSNEREVVAAGGGEGCACSPLPDLTGVVRVQVEAMRPVAERTQSFKNRKTGVAVIRVAEYLAGMADRLPAMSEDELIDWLVYQTYRKEPKALKLGAMPKEMSEADQAAVTGALAALDGLKDAIASAWTARVLPVLCGFVRYYEARLREAGCVDFKDLLLLTRDLLKRDTDVRDRLKERYQVLYVDEFQDTDPLQAEIVFFLSEAPGANAAEWADARPVAGRLFIVGDPKQSIYRFRRADLRVYNAAKARFSADEQFSIRTNFRSNRGMLDAFDSVFSGVPSLPDYQALLARPEAPEGGRNVVLIGGEAREAVPSAEECRSAQAACVAKVIRAMVTDGCELFDRDAHGVRPCHYGDFALLMRKMTNVDLVEDALAREGLPYRVFGGKAFYEQQEIQYTITLLRAIDNPLDSVSVVGALRSPFFGISDDELLLFKARAGRWNYLDAAGQPDGPVREGLCMLRRWHEQKLDTAPVRFLEGILRETHVYEFYLGGPSGERRVANLAKLLDQTRSLDRSGRLTFHKIVQRLRAVAQEGRREDEEESTTMEPNERAIRILTIHKAKGLEFPIVAVPFLSDTLGGGWQTGLIYDRMSGQVEVKLSSVFKTAGWDAADEAEAREEEDELARLLYVVLTRARAWLILPWDWPYTTSGQGSSFQRLLSAALKDAKAGEAFEQRFAWARWRTASSLPPSPESEALASAATGEAGLTLEGAARRREALTERLAGIQARLRRRPVVHPSELERREMLEREVAEGQMAPVLAGTLYHKVMEVVPLDADESVVRALCDSVAPAVRVPPGAIRESVVEMVTASLAHELFARVRSADRVVREYPFTLPLSRFGAGRPGQVLDGFIDLIFADGGRLVVVDYKTDHVSAAQCAEAAAQYLPQLGAYGLAVDALLPESTKGAGLELLLFFVRPRTIVSLTDQILAEAPERLMQAFLRAERGEGG